MQGKITDPKILIAPSKDLNDCFKSHVMKSEGKEICDSSVTSSFSFLEKSDIDLLQNLIKDVELEEVECNSKELNRETKEEKENFRGEEKKKENLELNELKKENLGSNILKKESLIKNNTKSKKENVKSNGKNYNCFSLQDLTRLYLELRKENKYIHEYLEDSTLKLPTNEVIPRNPELEKKCQQLRAQEENRIYKAMTKSVDNNRKKEPEESLAYQFKELNRQIFLMVQFIVTVLAGFAFGFLGLHYIYDGLDFGLRLLCGVFSALIIAVAELYFLMKRMNEDLIFEKEVSAKNAKSKLD